MSMAIFSIPREGKRKDKTLKWHRDYLATNTKHDAKNKAKKENPLLYFEIANGVGVREAVRGFTVGARPQPKVLLPPCDSHF